MVRTGVTVYRRIKARNRDRVRRGIRSNILHQENVIQNRFQNLRENCNTFSDSEPASNKLRKWAIDHNITRNALSELLKILITFGLTWLPNDARTLLETPQKTKVVKVANGEMWYNGIEKNIRQIFEYLDRDLELALNFNFDGIPLFKSARKEFWPILANFHSKLLKFKESIIQKYLNLNFLTDFPTINPFVVSIWFGVGKPNPINDFLFSFINELKQILANGIVLNGFIIRIRVRCFICDTPARSLLKGI